MKGLIFTYLLTYGGFLVSLFDPFWGLLVYICFAVIRPHHMWYWSVPQGNYSRIVAIGLILGWALTGFADWRFYRARIVVFTLIAYLLWSAVVATSAPNSNVAWDFVEGLAKVALPFIVGITLVDSVTKLKQIAWVIVLSQGYAALEFNLAYWSGYNRLHELGFGGMDNNGNAIALVSCVGLAFFLGLHADRWWKKAIAAAAVVLMIHAILFSYSRGGMLALIVTGSVAFLVLPKRPIYYVAFALVVALGVRLAGPTVTERFSTTFAEQGQRDESAEERLKLWAICWESMKTHPLGIGPDHFPLMIDRYGYRRGKQAHSLWLQTGADLGVPGLFLLALFYGSCIAGLWPYTRESKPVADPWFRYFARMVIASLTGFAVSAQFVSLSGLETPFYATLIGAGVLKLASQQESTAGLRSDRYQYHVPQWEGGFRSKRPAKHVATSFSTCRERSLPPAS
jgi:O-antigen ligase